MTIQIEHRKPDSPFFLVAYPKCKHDGLLIDSGLHPIIELKDPKNSDNVCMAELWDIWTFEEKDFIAMNGLARLAYGCNAGYLKNEMIKKYPQLGENFIVEYWLLKTI
jgi:hypothetical protein